MTGWAGVAGAGAGAGAGGAGGAGAGFGFGLMMVAAPRLQAEVAGRFDCAQAVASSSFGGAGAPPEPAPGPPAPSEPLPTPTEAGATGSCALLDQLLCAIGACEEVVPPLPPLPVHPEELPAAPCEAEGPGDEVGALPPTAAAHPPPLEAAGIADESAVSASSPAALGLSPVHAPLATGVFAAVDAPQPPLDSVDVFAACTAQRAWDKTSQRPETAKSASHK